MTTSRTVELAYYSEEEAHRVRRYHIANSRPVSLIAFDPARNLYVFDVTYRGA